MATARSRRRPAPRRPSRRRPEPSLSPVLVVGSVAFDDLSTPLGEHGRVIGGSATYAALAASFFAPVRLVGVVGGDFEPELPRLRRRRIDLGGLQIQPEGRTFYWSGEYHADFTGRTTRDTQLNVFAAFDPVLPDAYRSSRWVVLGNILPALQLKVLRQLKDRRRAFVAADTMNLWINTARADLEALLPELDLLVVNEEEAVMLTGRRNLILAGAELRQRGPRAVVIKLGPHGSALFHPKGYFTLPAYAVADVRDPTGAGDSYLGALVAALAAAGRSDFDALKTAIAAATATASLTVEALGPARLEKAGRAEINRRLLRLRATTQLP